MLFATGRLGELGISPRHAPPGFMQERGRDGTREVLLRLRAAARSRHFFRLRRKPLLLRSLRCETAPPS
jgi:hypothetical protein